MSKIHFILTASLAASLLVNLLASSNCLAAEEAVENEPPFPHLINPEQVGQNNIHLVSESVSDEQGYETTEEYVDFSLGKNAFVSTSKKGHSVTYVDSQANLIYHYKPYFCIGLKPVEMEMSGFEGLWNAEVNLKLKDGDKTMYLYGVAALWFNAGRMSKTYSKANMVYSASKDVYREAHKWTVVDEVSKTIVHLYFIETKWFDRYPLEMVQIESMETKKIKQTINILSIDNYIQSEIYDNLLQVPVGYGCVNVEVTEKALIEFPTLEDLYMGPLLGRSHRIELEATATKFEVSNGNRKSASDTISIELAKGVVKDIVGRGNLQLIRHRDTRQDIKTVLNYQYNVQYRIDLRSGSCEMSNMNSPENKYKGTAERVNITFGNGLILDMDESMMNTVFVNQTDFYFIKRISSGSKASEHLYFEKSTRLQGKPCRIVRVFSMQGVKDEIKLERVTLWFLDEKQTQIVESYHLNVIDAVELESGVELAKIFDISEECYLNNDKMRSGRDFVWFQLHYPLGARHSQLLSERSLQLKDEFYARFYFSGHLSFFRAPRLELMFEDTGFILRVLMLDIPSIPLVYDMIGHGISVDTQGNNIEDLTVDLDHCADLCRLNRCKTMSYCESTHECVVASERPEEGNRTLVAYPACECYALPDKANFDYLFELSLHNTISTLQHQDYGVLALPKVPDELAYPRSETGIDDETYKNITIEYLSRLYVYIDEEQHRLPMLTCNVNIEGALVILLPDRFEVEEDPLKEFRLNGRDSLENSLDDQDDKIPPFHQGLSMHRYRMSSQSLTSPDNRARLFTGLNYDQCSLACVDSKCSSFSYCQYRQECIITDIYNVSLHMDNVEVDFECFIAQRDFLHKFNRFQGVYRPNIYKRTASAVNPSECAHNCMIESAFKCLAFDYCEAGGEGNAGGNNKQLGTCFYQDERALYTGVEGLTDKIHKDNKKDESKMTTKFTGCDHYSRSYLADFVRIEYRQIDDSVLDNLKTTLEEGRSVDQCADHCVNELVDCSAFQFCFDPDTKTGPMQSCIMIESKPEDGSETDYQVVLNQTADGKIVKAGKFFVSSNNCHVFSLRRDTSEAHLRDLAFNSMTSEEYEARGKKRNGGLSVGGGIFLYFAMTLVFAAIGCGVSLAKNHNDYLRHRIERLRLLAGI